MTAPSTPQGAMPGATGDTTENVISGLNSVSNAIGQFYDNMLTQSRATAQNYENFFNDPNSYGKGSMAGNDYENVVPRFG